MESSDQTPQPVQRKKLNLALDLRLVCILLLAALVACLALWRPWTDTSNANDRVIEVTGEATLKAEPDEFSFNPSYQFDTDTKEAALADLTAKSNEVVAGLKQLGVSDEKIKSSSNGYENPSYPQYGNSKVSYTLQLTVTVNDSKLVQKVQDYLASTEPSGAVSPLATFSEAKRKTLEAKGRSAASKDARKKADQMAQELGFEVDKVKSIADTQQQGGEVYPLARTMMATDAATTSVAPQIDVQAGENELKYSVTVTYYIR